MTRSPFTALGLVLGIACGFAAAFGGFGAFIVVLALGIVGIAVGRVLDGDVDVSDYLGGRGRDRATR